MRVLKKVSTPFTQAKPDKAIIVLNSKDPQYNTIKMFMQGCDEYGIESVVFCNKADTIALDMEYVKQKLGIQTVITGSAKTGVDMHGLYNYFKLWSEKRIIILGVFNSGKTSIINYLCDAVYETGTTPGTTLKFTETEGPYETVVIDSVGQLIDINKPMMVSVDLSKCNITHDKIYKVFTEEIDGLIATRKEIASNMHIMVTVINWIKRVINSGGKLIVTGAGASALVAKEIAGQATECGIPALCFTNDGAEIQPVTFSKGLGENEGGISRYISNAVNRGDVVIAVSCSGGTGFTIDLLKRANTIGAITIAITENSDTPLGHVADYVLKSNAKPEGPSSSKVQTAHLVIGHTLILVLADELGISADEAVGHMLPEPLKNKKMGIK